MLGLRCYVAFSLVAESRGYYWEVVHGLLIAVASLAEQRLQGTWAQGFWSTGSGVLVRGFSCSVACGVFLDQGSNLCLLHWQIDSLPPSHQGRSLLRFYRITFYLSLSVFWPLRTPLFPVMIFILLGVWDQSYWNSVSTKSELECVQMVTSKIQT